MTNHLFYGLVTSAIGFAYTLVLYFSGYHTDKLEQGAALAWLGLVIVIGGLVYSLRAARGDAIEEKKAFSYSHRFVVLLMTTLFLSMGAAFFSYLYSAYVNTDMVEYVVAMQQQTLVEQGQPQEIIEQAEQMARMMSKPPFQAAMSFFGTLFLGLFLSLILAAFFKLPTKPQIGDSTQPG
jgi:hypothetical protein